MHRNTKGFAVSCVVSALAGGATYALSLTPIPSYEENHLENTKVESMISGVDVHAVQHTALPVVSGDIRILQDAVPDPRATDALSVSAPQQPQPTLAPAGAGGVPFTSITLTAGSTDATVRSILVQRAGPGADTVFESIVLVDEDGEEIGGEQRFNATHQAVLGDTLTIPAGTSKTLTVLGNITEDTTAYAGQTPSIQVIAINAENTVVGQLPIQGTGHIINDTLRIGGAAASLSSFDPGTNSNHSINETGIRFSGIRITANSQEDIALSSITWDQSGTASSEDIAHITTVVDGVAYVTEVERRSYTTTFPSDVLIRKGESVEVYVQGDLTSSGANRTVAFDINSSDDIGLHGTMYGFGVGVAASSNTATDGHSVFITSDGTADGDEGTPFFSGSVITINGATITSIGKAN